MARLVRGDARGGAHRFDHVVGDSGVQQLVLWIVLKQLVMRL